jgi:hypothetical protein
MTKKMNKFFPLLQLLGIALLLALIILPIALNKKFLASLSQISNSQAASISASFTCSTVTVTGLDPIASSQTGDYSLWIIGPGASEGQTTFHRDGATTTNLNFRRLATGMLRPGQDYAIYLKYSDLKGGAFVGQTHAVFPSSCPISKPILSNVINFGINSDCSALQATGLTPSKQYVLTVYGTNNFYRANITTGPMGVATNIFPNSQWPSSYLIPGQTAYFSVNDASNYDFVYGVNAVTVPQTCGTPAAPSNMKAVFDAGWRGMVLTWNDNSNNEQRFEFQHILTNGTTYSVFTQPNVTTAIDNDYNVSTCAMAHNVRFQVRAVIDTLISGYKYYSAWSPQFTFTCPPPADPTNVTAVPYGSGVLVRWQDNATNEANYWVGRSDIARPYGGVADYLPANTTSYQDNTISCPTVHGKSYKVNASNASGYSAIVYSPVVTCPATPPPVATPAPTAIASTPAPAPVCQTTTTDVILLMDASRSMDDDGKFAKSNTAAVSLVNSLYTDKDVKIALVQFASSSNTKKVIGFQSSSNKSSLISKINGMTTSTDTYMGKGLDISNKLMASDGRSGAKKYIVLLSDGRADDSSTVDSKMRDTKAQGIIAHTIGLGPKTTINEPQLQLISSTTGGSYYYIDSPNSLLNVYNAIAVKICPSLKVGP